MEAHICSPGPDTQPTTQITDLQSCRSLKKTGRQKKDMGFLQSSCNAFWGFAVSIPSYLSHSSNRSQVDRFQAPRSGCRSASLLALLSCLFLINLSAEGQSSGVTPATLTPSSGMLSASQTFTWTGGVGPTSYQLLLGTSGPDSSNIYNSGHSAATSAEVAIPSDGVTVFATLLQYIDGVWQSTSYTFTESGSPTLPTIVSPVPGSTLTGGANTFTWNMGAGPSDYRLYVGTTGVGTTDLYLGPVVVGSATTSESVSIPGNGVTVYVRLLYMLNGAWSHIDYTYTESGSPTLPSLVSPAPGSTVTAGANTFTWNPGAGPADYRLYVGTTGIGAANLYQGPVVVGCSTTSESVSIPANGVTVYVRLSYLLNGTWQSIDYTYTESGSPTPPTLVSPVPGSTLAGGADTFTWNMGAGPTDYRLYVGTSGVGASDLYLGPVVIGCSTTFEIVSIPAKGATVYVRLLYMLNGTWFHTDYTYTEPAPNPVLTLSATSIRFGTVAVGGTASGSVTLNSTGPVPVTVSADSVSGTGYAISGLNFPLTLNPGQAATLGITFNPTAAGLVNGTVTLISNASPGTTSTISLTGTGQPVLNGLTCANGTINGAGTDACTVTLNAAAGTGGQTVTLSSNQTAVTVPATVIVASGATTATFTATISAVSSAETASLTATSGGGLQTYGISLGAAVPTLVLQSTSVAFGDVTEGSPAYQTVTLTSSGTGPLTISAVTLTGSGYTMSGMAFPITLQPAATAGLEIEFNPTTTGDAGGTITLSSNSSAGATTTINLSGTGIAASYEVSLAWDEPTDSDDPVAGYNIYRAVSGSNSYQLINASIDSTTAYVDAAVDCGTSYTYYVESVDSEGNQSAPSGAFNVSVP
jgi:hypothetical protein